MIKYVFGHLFSDRCTEQYIKTFIKNISFSQKFPFIQINPNPN